MLLEKETFEKFNYLPATISDKSSKKLVVKCEYCDLVYDVISKNRAKSNKIVDKDCCKQCRYKKMADVNIAKYGVANVFAAKSVKDKIKQSCLNKYGCESYTQTDEFKEKAKQTNLELYGKESAIQNEKIAAKKSRTMIERYGVDNPSKVDEFNNKRKKTNLEKFGNEQFLGSEYAIEKRADTNIERYGVSNPFEAESVKEKIKQTNVELYGVEYPIQNPVIFDKVKNTNLIRYGAENIAQNKDIQDQIKATNLDRYGFEVATKCDKVKKKILKTKIASGDIKLYKNKAMKDWAKELGKAYTTFVAHVRKFGFDEAISIQPHENQLEKKIADWLDSINVKYSREYRVENRRADFYLSDHKLVIETDGLFWHSDQVIKDNKYHLRKRRLYISHGLRSLFFREDEINDRFEIVKSIVANKLGLSERIYARKCSFKVLDSTETKDFLKSNHLMGSGTGLAVALIYNGEIAAVLQARRKKGDIWEISRFCTKLGVSVVGGFSRLLKHFTSIHKPDEVWNFVDRRYGNGNHLASLGFTKSKTYISFRWCKKGQTCHRLKYRGNSGYAVGYAKLWDCGQTKYTLTINRSV